MKNENIIVTGGEPSGIGTDFIIEMLKYKWPLKMVFCVDSEMIQKRLKYKNISIRVRKYCKNKKIINNKNELTVIDVKTLDKVIPGKLNFKNSRYVINTLNVAYKKCLNKEFSSIITMPVHKGILNKSGFNFKGHTDFFSDVSKFKSIMLVVTKNFNVAYVTNHIPIKDISKKINKLILKEKILILIKELKNKLHMKNIKVYVTGLNPHAGENGFIGKEEIEIIIPVIKELQKSGFNIVGPYSPDTIFRRSFKKTDIVLSMYHDQSFPLIKQYNLFNSVNITLGLPFLRFSVCHGTALEAVKKNEINFESILYLLKFIKKIKK
ncbi:MAG: 4-hydroxythreonine-4-phosphate dehydrogenase PdxA [Enterobacteriaceae bacterium]